MKPIITSLLVLVSGVAALAQGTSGKIVSLQHPNNASGNRETVIWSEDFDSGIPASWVAAEQSGVANWEYRGDTTDPINEVGSRGSCTGSSFGAPIQSPTWTNGFVIFDSNYWDNDQLPCDIANFGTGQAPGPHFATLTTPTFDLSAYTYTGLNFHQYYKKFEGTIRVEMKVANAGWVSLWESDLSSGGTTSTDDEVRVPLGNAAAGQSLVQLRFVFDGNYYFWMIDDVELLQLDANDMSLRTTTYGKYDLYAPEHPTGFEELEYSQYPNEMPPLLKFSATVFNNGAVAQEDVRLSVSVENETTGAVLYTGTSDEGFVCAQTDEIALRAGSFQMPGDIGFYRVVYRVTQTATDANDNNDLDTLRFRITDAVLARDRGAVQSVFVPNDAYVNRPYEVGNVIKTTTSMSLQSVSVAFALGTATPATAYAKVYEVDFTGSLDMNLVATSETLSLNSSDINLFNGEVLKTFSFATSVTLQSNKAYLVVVASEDGAASVVVGMNGESDYYTSWVVFPANGAQIEEMFILTRRPIVRLNFGPFVGVPDFIASEQSVRIFPNPVQGHMQVDFMQGVNETLTIELYGADGKRVYSERITPMTRTWNMDTSALASGYYTVRIFGGEMNYTGQIVK
jgi:hypothetical protein